MITIGIATYNRKNILARMAESLYRSNLTVPYNIRVYDDASTEYGENELREIFPDAATIKVHEKNLGADVNTRFMYEDFLHSGDEYFFNADSDLIFSKNWLAVLLKVILYTDGCITAFNTPNHKSFKDIEVIDGILIEEKKSIGAAGTFFTRETVKSFIEPLQKHSEFLSIDFGFSDELRKQGKHIYALKNSVVQHIGIEGYNSDKGNFDYGKSFVVDSITNGQILNDTLFDVSQRSNENIQKKSSAKYCLFPFEKVPRGSKIIMYGAGRVGEDFCKQVKLTRMYSLLAVADKNFDNKKGVISPEKILDYDCDYIIIAISRSVIVEEVERNLLSMGIEKEKIISGCLHRFIR